MCRARANAGQYVDRAGCKARAKIGPGVGQR